MTLERAERDLFEAWCDARNRSTKRSTRNPAIYGARSTEDMWQGWLARAKEIKPEGARNSGPQPNTPAH